MTLDRRALSGAVAHQHEREPFSGVVSVRERGEVRGDAGEDAHAAPAHWSRARRQALRLRDLGSPARRAGVDHENDWQLRRVME